MKCPKDKKVELTDATLLESLAVKCCSSCEGTWIPSANYEIWQIQQQSDGDNQFPSHIPEFSQSDDFVPSPLDSKAGLCPECGSYLSRTKVNLKQFFYLERCPSCGGIWCDRGEWEVLRKYNLHTHIPQLFSVKWQLQMRETQHFQQERQILIDKLGSELAERLFTLADDLDKNQHGDFAVAYIMRRFDRGEKKEERKK